MAHYILRITSKVKTYCEGWQGSSNPFAQAINILRHMARPIGVVLIIIFFWNTVVYSQPYYDLYYGNRPKEMVPNSLLLQVHSLDEFIERYNGAFNAYGQPIDTTSLEFKEVRQNKDYWSKYKSLIIESLVRSPLRKQDSIRVRRFAEKAGAGEKLDFIDSSWWIEVPVTGWIEGLPTELLLQMKILVDDRRRIKWIIDDVVVPEELSNLPALPVIPNVSKHKYIPPSAHDNGFIALSRVLSKERDISPYIECSTHGLSALQYILKYYNFEAKFRDFYVHFQTDSGLTFLLDHNWTIIDFER